MKHRINLDQLTELKNKTNPKTSKPKNRRLRPLAIKNCATITAADLQVLMRIV